MPLKLPESPPEGEWPARLKYLRDEGVGQFGPTMAWGFDGEIDDGEIREFTALSSQKVSPKSKPGPWVVALLGRKVTRDDDWPTVADLEKEIKGKPCTIVAEENEDGFVNVIEVKPRSEPEPKDELADQPVRKARLAGETPASW